MRKLLFPATCLAIAVGCAAPTPAYLSEADLAAIRELYAELARTLSPEDNEAWARLYTTDARMMFEGTPTITGRAAIQEWGETASPVALSVSFADIDIHGGGNWAWSTATFAGRFDGVEAPVTGKQLVVLERQADGSWLIDVAHVSMDSPPPAG